MEKTNIDMKTGNTTRIVDRCVQEFFLRGTTYVYEGRNSPDRDILTDKCYKLFEKRMQSEHPEVQYDVEHLYVDRILCYVVTIKI